MERNLNDVSEVQLNLIVTQRIEESIERLLQPGFEFSMTFTILLTTPRSTNRAVCRRSDECLRETRRQSEASSRVTFVQAISNVISFESAAKREYQSLSQ